MKHRTDDRDDHVMHRQTAHTPAGPVTGPDWNGVDYELVRLLQRRVADGLTRVRQQRIAAGQRELDPGGERQLALSLIQREIADHVQQVMDQGFEPPDARVDAQLAVAVESAIFGAGALDDLLKDPQIENVDVNGCDEVWVSYADDRGKVRGAPLADSDEQLIEIVATLGAYAGVTARPFTPASPKLNLRLGNGCRLAAIMSASERPLVSIRRDRYPLIFLDDIPAVAYRPHGNQAPLGSRGGPDPSPFAAQSLLQLGTVDEELAAFLGAAVLSRCNIIVAGATNAGKTTLLRALLNQVPPGERLVTVERALEIGLRRHPHLHPDVAELEEVEPSQDGDGGLSIADLVMHGRRMNPSRVIVGEVVGPEVRPMLDAMSQGEDGSMSTIHAAGAAEALFRLAMYAEQHDGTSHAVTNALIGMSIHFVVFIRKNPFMQARRMVMEVLEVNGSADGQVTRSRIFTEGPDGRARRDREVPITRAAALARHGYHDTGTGDQWAVQPRSPVQERGPGKRPRQLGLRSAGPSGTSSWESVEHDGTWGV